MIRLKKSTAPVTWISGWQQLMITAGNIITRIVGTFFVDVNTFNIIIT
jgi:hypothetical protein